MTTTRSRMLAVLGLVLCCAHTVQAGDAPVRPEHRDQPDLQVNLDVAHPADAVIMAQRGFDLPLVPMVGAERGDENHLLALRLRDRAAGHPDTLAAFLQEHPESRWSVAVATNLGIAYRRQGRLGEALALWQQAWETGKGSTDPRIVAVVNRAGTEAALLLAWCGRGDAAEQLCLALRSRTLRGSSAERLSAAQWSIDAMRAAPDRVATCGQDALGALAVAVGRPHALAACGSLLIPAGGASLGQLAGWAQQAGLQYQAAVRVGSAVIPTPAIMHWKLGHYSVIRAVTAQGLEIEDGSSAPWYPTTFTMPMHAFEREASGLLLVPVDAQGHLPHGWRTATQAECEQTVGRCRPSGFDPDDPARNCSLSAGAGGCSSCGGMPQYYFSLGNVALRIKDTPLAHNAALGPDIPFTITYNNHEAHQDAIPSMSHVGANWTHSWNSFIVVDPAWTTGWTDGQGNDHYGQTGNIVVQCYPLGGGYEYYAYHIDDGSGNSKRDPLTGSSCVSLAGTLGIPWNTTYAIHRADGSVYYYGHSDGSASYPQRRYLTAFSDVLGRVVQIHYSNANGGRISDITDFTGQAVTFSYASASDPLAITTVTDPHGRQAQLEYDTTGRLTAVTDTIGMRSTFAYDGVTTSVASMTTPYGTTTFACVDSGLQRQVDATDPMGDTERVMYSYPGLVTETGPTPTGMLTGPTNYHCTEDNTLYWDRKAMRMSSGNWSKAVVYNWFRKNNLVTSVLQSLRKPYESRVWFNYPGQSTIYDISGVTQYQPSLIGRVVEGANGQQVTQLTQVMYSGPFPSQVIDPLGRRYRYGYDPIFAGVFLSGMWNGTDWDAVHTVQWDAINRVYTSTDAAGQQTTITLNNNAEIASIEPPARAGHGSESTTFTYYGSSGSGAYRLKRVSDPEGGYSDIVYDGLGRPRTVTDQEGYAVTMDYDAFDRPTRMTYPDGTYEETTWDRLDPVARRDRTGQVTHMLYTARRQLAALRDAKGQLWQFNWCLCGALQRIVDPEHRITTWKYDEQGRVTAKGTDDGAGQNFAYEPWSGRVKSITDAKGQITAFSYGADGALAGVAFSGTAAALATPEMQITYDPLYPRILRRRLLRESGAEDVNYTYYPFGQLGAGQVSAVTGVLPNSDQTVAYDAWGQAVSGAVAGAAWSAQVDGIGRLQSMTDVLGTTDVTYQGASSRLSTCTYPNGLTASFAYGTAQADFALTGIQYALGGTAVSSHTIASNVLGNVTAWTSQVGTGTASAWTFEYDQLGQLQQAVQHTGSLTGAITASMGWGYDGSGNRTTSLNVANGQNQVTGTSFTAGNRSVAVAPGGVVELRAHLDEPGTATVNGQSRPVDPQTNGFAAQVAVPAGAAQTSASVTAADFSGNTHTYQVTMATFGVGMGRFFQYDANGNCIADGLRSYEWDALDRLIAINQGTHRSEFTYDINGHRSRIIEKDGGAITADHWYVWAGNNVAEERAGDRTTVIKRYAGEGFAIIAGANAGSYFYTTDHLGSIRELVDAAGVVRARYDYDTWGMRQPVAAGIASWVDSDLGYTGHWNHRPTGLAMAWFRAYDPSTGRWLSQDPIGYRGGFNLYGYVGNSPTGRIDPFGLDWYNDWGDFMNTGVMTVLVNPTTSNLAAGFGDGISFGGSKLIRDMTPGRNAVDTCASSYQAAWWAGAAYATAMGGVGSLAPGAGRALFYSGGETALNAARALAQKEGLTMLENTLGGQILNGRFILPIMNRIPGSWSVASGIFSLNVRGGATAVLNSPGATSVWLTVERPILNLMNQAIRVVIP